MRRVPRVLALVLLGLGVLVATAAVIYILVERRATPSEGELHAMSSVRRGLVWVIHGSYGTSLAILCGLGAAVGAWFGVSALRGNRLALLVVGVIALGGIGAVWGAHRMIRRLEDPAYRHRSVYVRAATRTAWAGTVYFGALGASAIAGFVLARRRDGAAPGAPTSPAPSPG